MKITIIGATGMIGSRLVSEAAARGHRVIAAARRPGQHEQSGVTSIALDASRAADLDAALAATDAVILTVRAALGAEHTIAPMTTTVLDAAARVGARVLVVGGAGPLHSPTDPELLVIDDPAYVPTEWRSVAGASTAQLHACHAHQSAQWVYLSPPAVLEPGARTGSYLRGTTTLLTDDLGASQITAEDLAVAAIDELERPGRDRHFTVARRVRGQLDDTGVADVAPR